MDMSIKTVDAYIAKAKTWKAEITKLREIILDSGLTEEIKWAKPCYSLDGKNVVLIMPLKEHCALLLPKGALLKDPKGILVLPGENTQSARQIRFTSLREIEKLEAALKAILREAIKAEKAGLKVEMTKSSNFEIPEELQQEFDRTPALRTAFTSLTPGRQRAYVIFISAAKQSQTRQARIEKYREQILEGRGMMD